MPETRSTDRNSPPDEPASCHESPKLAFRHGHGVGSLRQTVQLAVHVLVCRSSGLRRWGAGPGRAADQRTGSRHGVQQTAPHIGRRGNDDVRGRTGRMQEPAQTATSRGLLAT